MSEPSRAVFLSYASQDAEPARRICDALRAAGIEVWFDQSELTGGDVWDQKIRRQIRDCGLFVPIISRNSQSRVEGYFRLEWHLADQRTHLMGRGRAFIVPVCVDSTLEAAADAPESFLAAHWTRLTGGEVTPAFIQRITALLSGDESPTPAAAQATSTAPPRASAPRPDPAPGAPAMPSVPQRAGVLWRSRLALALGLLVALLIAGVLLYRGGRYGPGVAVPATAAAATEHSIAVLPFADLSEKHDQEYFGDGMAEEILNVLVRVPGLKVVGHASSFQYRGHVEDPGKIGAALGAAYLVEGSVRRSADRVRVTAELISTHDGLERWSNTYDRDVHDVLQVQDEIATSVVRALQMEVKSASYLPKEGTLHSTEAYETYLKGYHAHDEYSPAGLDEAVADFRRALELDPTFVPAAELLALTIRNQASYSFIERGPGFESARRACQEVLKLDPGSGLAHAILGDIAIEYDWDWDAADREFKKALALSPSDANVLLFSSLAPWVQGDLPQTLRLIEQSLNVDPFDSGNTVSLGSTYLAMDRLADAERAFRHALDIAPTQVDAHGNTGIALLLEDRPREALAEALQEPDESFKLTVLALCYHTLHRDKEADVSLEQLIARYAGSAAFSIADVYVWRGQADAAFQWLDRAYTQRDPNLFSFKTDVLIRRLAGDPRYKAFERKMKLPG
jgi:TolB-like protein/Tfp pilus assembly protein PilF